MISDASERVRSRAESYKKGKGEEAQYCRGGDEGMAVMDEQAAQNAQLA